MLERKESSVTIFRGDDTGGQLGKTIVINFHCDETVDMEGVVVTFVLGGFYEKEFLDVHDGDKLEIFMTHEQTAKLPLGVSFGKLYGTDASGKIRTFSNRIPIRVTNHVREAYGDAEESGIDVTIGNAIAWDSIYGKPETFPPSEHRHPKSDIDDLEDDLQTLSDGVESAIEVAEAAKAEITNKYDKTGGPISGDVSISGSFSLTGATPKIGASQKEFSFPTESGTLARAEDYYTTEEVDDKISRFAAHYLTDKVGDEFVPFATHAALDDATAHHSEANPRFFYAGEGFTPTKNDYCVVLADETHGGKTTRYSYVGEWPTGEWQYQYTINNTAFTEAQWAAINSGVTEGWMASTLSAATTALNNADEAQRLADGAQNTANEAYSLAETARSTADQALADAGEAAADAEIAQNTASEAWAVASNADEKAEEALAKCQDLDNEKLGRMEPAEDSWKLGGVNASEYALKTDIPTTDIPTRVKNDADTSRIDGEGNVYDVTNTPTDNYITVTYNTGTVRRYNYNRLSSSYYEYKWTGGNEYLNYRQSDGRISNQSGLLMAIANSGVDPLDDEQIVVSSISATSITSIVHTPQKSAKTETVTDSLARESQLADHNTSPTAHADIRDRIDAIELSVRPNISIVGNPTFVEGNVSGFSANDYLVFPTAVDVRENTVEFYMAFTTGANVTTQQNLMDSSCGLACAVRGGKFVTAVSTNGTSFAAESEGGTIDPNSSYRLKIAFAHADGVYTTKTYLATGEGEYAQIGTSISLPAPVYPTATYWGGANPTSGVNHIFGGVINLAECRMVWNGTQVWSGYNELPKVSYDPTATDKLDTAEKIVTATINEIRSDLDAIRYPVVSVTNGQLVDRAVNVLTVSNNQTINAPSKTVKSGITYARDFVVRIEVGSTAPSGYSWGFTPEVRNGDSWDTLGLLEANKKYIYRFTDVGGSALMAAREEVA